MHKRATVVDCWREKKGVIGAIEVTKTKNALTVHHQPADVTRKGHVPGNSPLTMLESLMTFHYFLPKKLVGNAF